VLRRLVTTSAVVIGATLVAIPLPNHRGLLWAGGAGPFSGADIAALEALVVRVVQQASKPEPEYLRALRHERLEAIADVLPWNNGWPGAEPKIRRLNELIAEIARAEDVTLLPFHDTLEDPDRPGRMRQEWTSDGDHPSVEGYRRLGELAFRLPG